MNFRIRGEKFLANADHGRLGRRDAQVIQKYRRDPFIHQNPAMLRIVDEFHDVSMAVGGFEQMSLRSAAHLADQPAGVGGHERLKSSTVEII